MRKNSHREEKKFSPGREKILIGKRKISHAGEKKFSSYEKIDF